MTEQVQQPFSGEAFKQKLIDAGFISADVRGCSTEEIEQVKKWQQVNFLPQAYVEYLSAIGDNTSYCDPFHNCEYWGHWVLQHAKSDLENDLEFFAHDTLALPKDAFVFAQYYQGYYWLYFLTGDKNPNPPVYLVRESTGSIKVGDSFTEFLFERFNAVMKRLEKAKIHRAISAKELQEKSVAATLYAHQSKPEPIPKLEKSKSLWEQIADFLGLSR